MTTLQELYEHFDAKTISYKVVVGGADVSSLVTQLDWAFDISQVPTASFEIPANLLVPAVSEEASVEIWVGFKLGMINLKALVFGGGIVQSVSYNGPIAVVECVQDGARRLTVPYYRQIEYEFDNVTAQDSVVALLGLAGVVNYLVDLDPWDIGTAVPQKLQFSNYGEAINKVSEVDGSPWYCMPSGQIRVEKRDPLPYEDPARVYYGSGLLGIAEDHPTLDDASLRPRVLNLDKNYDREGVANFIEVDGAVLVTLGPNGEQNSEQIQEEVDGAPGTFSTGAPWIPTPPLFQMFTLQNELIDTNAKANSVANRYYTLKNRLIQNVQISVPLDPLLFLAMTARIIDPETNTDDFYFLRGYRCSLSASQAISELTLLGGPYSGTQGHAAPFAEFLWKYQAFYDQMSGNNPPNSSRLNLGWNSDLGAKLCQDLPAGVGSPSQGGDLVTGKSMVMITFDASSSQDFDGRIVQYDWSDDQGNTKSSILPRFTVMYDPDEVSTVQMTLMVTDDTARTDTITKSVYTAADAPPSPLPDDPTMDDTLFGGGQASGPCTEGGSPNGSSGPGGKNGMALVYFVAAGCVALASADNREWNALDKDDLGVGDFISVGVSSIYDDRTVYAVFGTDSGELVLTTDGCQTGTIVFEVPGGPAVTDIVYDTEEIYRVWATTEDGRIYTSTDSGQTWSLHGRTGSLINRLLVIDGNLVVFGGDTGSPETLVQVDIKKNNNWTAFSFSGDIAAAIGAAGPGHSIYVAAANQNSLLIGFGESVDPLVWSNIDPARHPENWVAADIPALQVLAAAPGADGKYIVATNDGLYRTTNNENFDLGDTGVNVDLSWEGLDGVYLGLKADSVTKTIDDGNTQGDMLPNPDFSNEADWPDCAVGHRVRTAVIPRDDNNGAWPAPVIIPPAGAFTGAIVQGVGSIPADTWVFWFTQGLDEAAIAPTGTGITVAPLDDISEPDTCSNFGYTSRNIKTWLIRSGSTGGTIDIGTSGGGVRILGVGDTSGATETHGNALDDQVIADGSAYFSITVPPAAGAAGDITVAVVVGAAAGASVAPLSNPFTDGTTPAPHVLGPNDFRAYHLGAGRPSWSWLGGVDTFGGSCDGAHDYGLVVYLKLNV